MDQQRRYRSEFDAWLVLCHPFIHLAGDVSVHVATSEIPE